MKKLFIILICCVMAGTGAYAEELLIEELEEKTSQSEEVDPKDVPVEKLKDRTFWTQEVDFREEWGIWLKEYYKPYADDMTLAMLKIVASTADIDFTGKTSAEILEEVNAAYTKSLRSMEMIKHPPELKAYHAKVVELYKQAIKADPKDKEQNAIEIERLTQEADEAMTRALRLHGVPQGVINYINKN